MNNTAINEKIPLTPLLQKLCQTKRYPNALLLHGQNPALLFDQMKTLAETIINKTIPITNETPDYFEPINNIIIIKTEQRIKIELIKQLQERIKYGAHDNEHLIIFIHQCQNLTISSTNALLKTLEEPKKNTLFLMSSTNKNTIPKTILSRCHKFYISENNQLKENRMNQLTEGLMNQITPLSATDFMALPTLDKIIFIQSLPYDPSVISSILTVWQFELNQKLEKRNQLELKFLEKIIEIIHNIKYNLNLKLQLIALTFEFEEEQSNGTPRQA